MAIVGVVQGRLGSTRLPGKLLAPVAGRPLLELLMQRVAPSEVEEWWLATTDLPEDDRAADVAQSLGMQVYRGSSEDVLSRFAAITARTGATWVLRLTGDNPFVDAAVVDRLASSATQGVHHVGEATPRRLPLGYVPELVAGADILEAAARELPPHHRVHVTSWVRQERGSLAVALPDDWPRRPEWRWTVDTDLDLAMADAAFRAFADPMLGYPAMVDVLDGTDIPTLNAGVRQKEVAEG